MRACIIGAGSIGLRHAKNFIKYEIPVCFVSRRGQDHLENIPTFSSLKNALEEFKPDIVWICSETKKHFEDLEQLDSLFFSGTVYIEKPLFIDDTAPLFRNLQDSKIFITYQLRFHRGLKKLKEELVNKKILSATIYVGQHLSQWRPDRDFKQTYSSNSLLGGGVLRDLSHEVDYAIHLFGQPSQLVSTITNSQSLGIAAEDLAKVSYNTISQTLVSIEMNYLDQIARRYVLVHTSEHSYLLDFINGTLEKDGKIIMKGISNTENYIQQHEAIISNTHTDFCTYTEGLNVMSVIKKIEANNILAGNKR